MLTFNQAEPFLQLVVETSLKKPKAQLKTKTTQTGIQSLNLVLLTVSNIPLNKITKKAVLDCLFYLIKRRDCIQVV